MGTTRADALTTKASGAGPAGDPRIEPLCAAIDDLARMLEAVRYSVGLGAKQIERVNRAKETARLARGEKQ